MTTTSQATEFPYTKAEAQALTQNWWVEYSAGAAVALNDFLKLSEDLFKRYVSGQFSYKDEPK